MRSDLEDLLAFKGNDICIFVFSTAIDDNSIQEVINKFADLAKLVSLSIQNTENVLDKHMVFIAYDLNKLGPNSLLEIGEN